MIILKILIILFILFIIFYIINTIILNPENFNHDKTIYFIIEQSCTHKNIATEGAGASEFLFYITLYKLSKYYNVIVYNKTKSEVIDGISYNDFIDNDFIKNINNSVVIIQRSAEILKNLRELNKTNNYILWTHDYMTGIENDEYLFENNITIITVSKFHLSTFPKKNNVKFIYNALFPEYFIKNNDIKYDKNKIIFASAWTKGLNHVLNIGKAYYDKNKDFQLVLIKPAYATNSVDIDFNKFPFLNIKGIIKNKQEYCELIQSCLCVLTTTFSETFGCVYAEALHLGVPVIGDNSVKSAISEIVQPEHMCNYNNVDEVINKIEEFRNNRPIVNLNTQFYENAVIKEWINLIDSF